MLSEQLFTPLYSLPLSTHSPLTEAKKMPSKTTKYPGLNFNPFLLSLRVDVYPPPMVKRNRGNPLVHLGRGGYGYTITLIVRLSPRY